MASLTNTAIVARKIIRYGIFFFIFLIVARIALNIGGFAYKKLFPPKPAPPTVSFGKIPKIPFPNKGSTPTFKFILETPEGGLPTVSDQIKVYFIPKSVVNLYSFKTAKQKAAALGFDAEAQQLSPILYSFASNKTPAVLKMNIVDWTFSMSYDLKADSSPLNARPQVVEEATTKVKDLLASAGLLSKDLTGPVVSSYLKLEQSSLVEALSLSDAKLTKISLFRKPYDKLPCLTANPKQSNVWFLVSGAEGAKRFVAGEYLYYKVDEAKSSTYPTKTIQNGWEELTQNAAYVVNSGQNNDGDEIKIRRVYVAYFDPSTYTEFLQPIFVFEGDRDFVAYVPAIAGEYYGN